MSPFTIAALLIGSSCFPPQSSAELAVNPQDPGRPTEKPRFDPPPRFLTGPLAPEVAAAVEEAFGPNQVTGPWDAAQREVLMTLGASGDVRLGWLLSDLMRMTTDRDRSDVLTIASAELLGIELDPGNPWKPLTNQLIAWDVPAPPGYLDVKRLIFTQALPGWEQIFQPGELDWRHVTWGGVRIDDRPFGKTDVACNCIPAVDNPEFTDALGAAWLQADDIVFGIEVEGEFRAYPRQIMEVREMVNDTLGGRQLGIPYCTLCASAQAYFTDRMPAGVDRPVLRTSGLLIRSNKVMYDLNTYSIFDTFLGAAVTGPLAARGITLAQTGVVTTTWGRWKAAHPTTTVLSEKLALGRNFDFRNGRDAHGPIFPIGDVDPRLPVQQDILGVLTGTGTAVAFPVAEARAALLAGEMVAFEEIHIVLDAGGLRAVDPGGESLGSHQAFWFAWSQFHPETALWSR